MSFSTSPQRAAKSRISSGIGEVAPLGGVAHQQVLEHQEPGDLLLAGGEREPLAGAGHELPPLLRVVAAQALAHVVVEHAQVEGQRILQGAHPAPLGGRLLLQLARAQRLQPAQREERVHVGGVHVVGVVLVLREDAPELGEQRAQDAQLVQLEEQLAARARPGEQRLQSLDHRRIGAVRLQRRQRRHHLGAGARIELQALGLGQLEELQHPRRGVGEVRGPGPEEQPPAQHAEAAQPALLLEPGEPVPLGEDAGDHGVRGPPQHGRRQVVVAHELLDRELVRAAAVAEGLGDRDLVLEGQAILLASPQPVQLVARAQQDVAGGAQVRGLLRREDRHPQQLGHARGAVALVAQPAQDVQIAQPALPLLEVGLEHVQRSAEALPPRLQLRDLRVQEGVGGGGGALGAEQSGESLREVCLSGEGARIQQRGAQGVILRRRLGASLRRAHAEGDGALEIPQDRAQRLGEGLDLALREPGIVQEQQVQIRARRQLAPAVASEREQGHLGARGEDARRVRPTAHAPGGRHRR